jgi:hypothetical protein
MTWRSIFVDECEPLVAGMKQKLDEMHAANTRTETRMTQLMGMVGRCRLTSG